MPFKPKKPCSYSACPLLVNGSDSKCPEHRRKINKKYDQIRDKTEERRFIHSTQWRAIRENKLSRNPLCERCLKPGYDMEIGEKIPHDIPATMVHHLDENQLNMNDENLQSLCNNCHEEIHKSGRFRGNK